MASDLNVIRAYLVPRSTSFWKWSPDGEAIVGLAGHTIAFRRELELVLMRQLSTGLPPLGPIVLLLAACRDSWSEISKELGSFEELLDQLESLSETQSPGANALAKSIRKSLTNLNQVYALPDDLRTNSDAKAELVAATLEGLHERTTPELAAEIVAALDAGLPAEFLQPDFEPSPTMASLFNASLFNDLKVFSGAWRALDADALRLRLAIGLDREVIPTEVEEPLAKRVRKLLDRLKDDREFSGMVRLTRNLMAIVHLPRPLDVPDEMPVGGVSDISQRGTLDRLLISELAQDDQMLMLRLAMNEALYLRRETPPANPPRSRVIVLDSGLRLWGVPRVFATSVALSLAALTEATIDLCVLRPEGDRLRSVDLATRQGLIDHMKVLRPESHPARALANLDHHLVKTSGEVDAILITSDEVAADSEFRREMAEWNPEIAFLLTVSRNGGFRLMQRTVHGTTVLREAKLDLEELLAPTTRPTTPLIDPKRTADLPAILRISPFPLRLSHHPSPQQSWWLQPPGVLSVTNDRRLMYWVRPFLGAMQLTDRLPARQVIWCRGTVEDGRTQFIVGDTGRPRLWLVNANLQQHDCQVAGLATTLSPVRCICDHAGMLFVVHKRQLDLVDMYSGNRLQGHPIPGGFRWIHSRFFRAPDAWYALSYDGSSARFEKVVSYSEFADWLRLIAMFDVKGVQGPVGVCRGDGSLFFTADRKQVPLKRSLQNVTRVRQIARDGRRFRVDYCVEKNRPELAMTALIHTLDQTLQGVPDDPRLALEPSLWEIARPRNLRTHFRSVGAVPGALFLETRRGQVVCLRFSMKHEGFALLPLPSVDPARPRTQPFAPLHGITPGVGYRLAVATFPDGSKVYLDSRGLLHLKSSDRQIPEATFVMQDDDAAGWCADGRMWGKSYFLGSPPAFPAYQIQESVLTPFTRGLS
jgi:hypothetical protein